MCTPSWLRCRDYRCGSRRAIDSSGLSMCALWPRPGSVIVGTPAGQVAHLRSLGHARRGQESPGPGTALTIAPCRAPRPRTHPDPWPPAIARPAHAVRRPRLDHRRAAGRPDLTGAGNGPRPRRASRPRPVGHGVGPLRRAQRGRGTAGGPSTTGSSAGPLRASPPSPLLMRAGTPGRSSAHPPGPPNARPRVLGGDVLPARPLRPGDGLPPRNPNSTTVHSHPPRQEHAGVGMRVKWFWGGRSPSL